MSSIIVVILLIINAIGWITMYADKRRAKRGKWRISERTLMILALCFGAFGILLAMLQFKHKTKKPLFIGLVPCLMVVQFALLTWLFNT